MIRKSTLAILLLAVLLGGGTYYYTTKHTTPPVPPDASKPVFSFPAAEVQSVTLSHPADAKAPAVQMQRQGDGWEITQPMDTAGDSSSIDGIVDGLAEARSSQGEPGTPDRLKAYGLDPGAVAVEFALKSGTKHKVVLGDKDFTGEYVYAVVDSQPKVTLLPDSLLTSADKSADQLRDHAVLHVDADQAASIELKNASGDVAARKGTGGWTLTKPEAANADGDSLSSLISAVATAKMTTVASEKTDNLAKYGLASPAITLTVTNDIGKAATLVVGKKQGSDVFARDLSRPTIFQIDMDLYEKLSQGETDFLDKTPLHFDQGDINGIEIHEAGTTLAATRKSGDDWVIDSPDAQKGKAAAAWKVFTPVTGLKAEEVIEKPSAAIRAGLGKPAYELVLTDKSGKKLTLRVSEAAGDFVYAQSSEGGAVFRLKKAALSELKITAADFVS